MIPRRFVVHIVDDDADVVKALSRLLRAYGHEVRTFSSPDEFLARQDRGLPGCAILDVAMPGMDGLQLQRAMMADDVGLPIIFITGRGDIPTSVRAIKAGASDFLTKPVDEEALLAAIARLREQELRYHRAREELSAIRARLARLTPREREVLKHVLGGQLNKQIAVDLGTVEKTIKVHRGRVMRKLGARSVVELVQMAERAGIGPQGQAGEVDPPPAGVTAAARYRMSTHDGADEDYGNADQAKKA